MTDDVEDLPPIEEWPISKKGNSYIRMEGYTLTITSNDEGFGFAIYVEHLKETIFSKRCYHTENDALEIMRDRILKLEEDL